MARKRTVPKMPATETSAAEPALKPVRLDLTSEAHKLLRVVASMEGKSMSAYARDHFEDFIRAEAKRRGVKL